MIVGSDDSGIYESRNKWFFDQTNMDQMIVNQMVLGSNVGSRQKYNIRNAKIIGEKA